MDHKIPRNEFIKFYIGNEINPNLKTFLDTNHNLEAIFSIKTKRNLKILEKDLIEISSQT